MCSGAGWWLPWVFVAVAVVVVAIVVVVVVVVGMVGGECGCGSGRDWCGGRLVSIMIAGSLRGCLFVGLPPPPPPRTLSPS